MILFLTPDGCKNIRFLKLKLKRYSQTCIKDYKNDFYQGFFKNDSIFVSDDTFKLMLEIGNEIVYSVISNETNGVTWKEFIIRRFILPICFHYIFMFLHDHVLKF